MLAPFRSATGLPLITHYTQHGIDCEISWPDDWRVTPADALQRALIDRLGARSAVVEYT
jgi:DNA polymerase-3 subunit alpha